MSAAPIRCEDCGRRFVDNAALFQHRRYKHKEPFQKSRALLAEAIGAAIYDAFDTTPPGRSLTANNETEGTDTNGL